MLIDLWFTLLVRQVRISLEIKWFIEEHQIPKNSEFTTPPPHPQWPSGITPDSTIKNDSWKARGGGRWSIWEAGDWIRVSSMKGKHHYLPYYCTTGPRRVSTLMSSTFHRYFLTFPILHSRSSNGVTPASFSTFYYLTIEFDLNYVKMTLQNRDLGLIPIWSPEFSGVVSELRARAKPWVWPQTKNSITKFQKLPICKH